MLLNGPNDSLIPLGVGFVLCRPEFFYSKLFWTLLGFLLQVNVGVHVICRPSPSIKGAAAIRSFFFEKKKKKKIIDAAVRS
jgi:hypothetical protein